MKYILSKEQMRQTDYNAMTEFGVCSSILMENAAHSSANIIKKIYPPETPPKNMLVFCGVGNNGGDGFAIARHLHEYYNVFIFWLGDECKMSPETKANFHSCIKLGIYTQQIENDDTAAIKINYQADYIIDALIGVGGSEDLHGTIVSILQQINGSNAQKIAIDIPSGLNADTGASHVDTLIANHTITMFAPKKGMYLAQGMNLCGEIHQAHLGVPERIAKDTSSIQIIEAQDVPKLLPKRNRISSKFNYGRVLVIGGSKSMPGAITLAANATIGTGAGLVEMMTTQLHPAILPEIMPTILEENEYGGISYKNIDAILASAERADTIAIGPGMGKHEDTIKITGQIIEQYKNTKNIVIDADALRAINSESKLTQRVILTPHIMEFARCFNIPICDIINNSDTIARDMAKKLNCIILLKHIPTIITDGELSYFNIIGNPGMASAGSGDVLTGIIAAMVGQKQSNLSATALSAYFHAKAGDTFAQEHGQLSLTASQLINYIPMTSV